MRRLASFLVAVLLNVAVLSAQTVDPDTLNWIKSILNGTVTTDQTTSGKIVTQPTTETAINRFATDENLSLDQDLKDYDNCTTPEGFPGLCVSYKQCVEGLIDNTTLIDLRDGGCPHFLTKCCRRSDFVKVIPTLPPPPGDCGWTNSGASIFRIQDPTNINRKTYADFGEFPWMIALLMKNVDPSKWSQKHYIGGGTLIHPSVVITVAHKVDRLGAGQIKCRAGEWDTQSSLELLPHQERDVKKIITHDDFYITAAINDISMLILEQPFELKDAPNIGIACLSAQLPTLGTNCFSMGWGKDFLAKDKYAVILKKVELPFVESNRCQDMLRTTRLTKRYNLHASHLCAGGVEGVDTCKGDGGSPLVCPIAEGPDSTRYAVYGLVAFGVGCGGAVPGVYANIPHLHPWVNSKMVAEGFAPSYNP